jgi:molybdopterin synthase sulfur carrier subunit
MVDVVLSRELARQFTDGETRVAVEAGTMRALVRELDANFPGIGAVLDDGMAVAIDGQIFQDFFLEEVGPNSEVCFLPAIEGG